MGSGQADEAHAVAALRAGVEFYAGKAEKLKQRQAQLTAELEKLQAELAKSASARDQLDDALQELLKEQTQQDDVPEGGSSDDSAENSRPSSRSRERAAGRSSASGRNRELWREVLQVLATAGRPMHVREIAAALGRPTKGKAGAAAVETIRATCKRQVKHERAVEGPVAVFAIAREPGSLRGVA